ncbi:hypothetical protein JOF53_001466 [Crossiella equi]|uniref:DUF3048 domain-containing protein n=1 Tax=Crossiella equi TaxID=130796 RepID=A0ABS5A7M0_9PSEU|nr:DUF3048 domain-containing protein [Crossiella equi]MBP2472594.1 hypothetical protein [Crossiella equi]
MAVRRAALALLLVLAGCSGEAPPVTSGTSTPGSLSPLTGLPADPGGPVLAVKVDNLAPARPQAGLSRADVLYLEPVEGGLTRFVAVFGSTLPGTVGPVRSARETDLELLAQYGRPALAYSGSAPELAPRIDAAALVPVPPGRAGQAYRRDPRRAAPHDLYADPAQLRTAAIGAQPVRDIGFRFGAKPDGGSPVTQHQVRYPATSVTISPQEGRWRIALDGAPLADAEGGAVTPGTVVVQRVPVRESPFRDVRGSASPFAQTVGTGQAQILRDANVFEARWSRPDATSGTSFTLVDGRPLPFAPGPVLVLLVPAANL